MTTAAIVLAAGGGRRFEASGGDRPKLLGELHGRPIVRLAVDAAVASGIGPVGVVLRGPDDLAAAVLPRGVAHIENPRWAEGMATSLAAGLAWARELGVQAVVVGLGDQPFVEPAAWRLVAAATSTPLAVATYDGERANPVRLAAEVWPMLPVAGDEGARSLLQGGAVPVTEVPCPGSGADVDTVEDLDRWNS